MNGIFAISVFLMTAFYPSYFPDHVSGISANILYEPKVHYFTSIFGEKYHERMKRHAASVALYSKRWKRIKEKDVRNYLGIEKTTIDVWMFGEKESDYLMLIRQFNDNAPHISVNTRTFLDEEDYIQLLQERLSGDNPPDVVLINSGWFSGLSDYLSPFPKDIFSYAECQDFFFPFVCDAFYGDGEMYAIPFFVDPLLMIANKSMLRDDRIAVNDHPSQLWTGLLENGKKFERFYDGDKGGPPAVFLRLKKSEESHILPKILTTLLLQVEKKEALQKESLLEILTYLKELDDIGFAGKAKTSYARDAGGSMAEQFLDEKVAVYFGTHSDYKTMVDMLISKKGNVQKSDLEVYPPPRVSRLDSGIFSGESWAFAVSKNASDPGPSLAFLAFLTEETSHVTYSQNNGKISARRLVADRGVFREVGDASRVPPGQTGTFEFQKEFSEELLQMFSGNKTPEEVADFVLSYLPDYDS